MLERWLVIHVRSKKCTKRKNGRSGGCASAHAHTVSTIAAAFVSYSSAAALNSSGGRSSVKLSKPRAKPYFSARKTQLMNAVVS
jgi:hypothetical protein